jgi:hypothetical protein
MGLIVMMLTVAFVPTGNYAWFEYRGLNDPRPSFSSQAICYFAYDPTISADITRLLVGFSVALVTIGYIVRVVLLHEYFSRILLSHWRKQGSNWSRVILNSWWEKWQVQTKPDSLRRRVIYHPLLAAFLTTRIAADMTSSMFLEVLVSLVGIDNAN